VSNKIVFLRDKYFCCFWKISYSPSNEISKAGRCGDNESSGKYDSGSVLVQVDLEEFFVWNHVAISSAIEAGAHPRDLPADIMARITTVGVAPFSLSQSRCFLSLVVSFCAAVFLSFGGVIGALLFG
jgi:hypothetical protein